MVIDFIIKIFGNNFSRPMLSLEKCFSTEPLNHLYEWKWVQTECWDGFKITSFFLYRIPTIITFCLSVHKFCLLQNGHYWLLFKSTKTKLRAVDLSANSKHTIFQTNHWQRDCGNTIEVYCKPNAKKKLKLPWVLG